MTKPTAFLAIGNRIDCILIGEELDAEYIAGLSGKVYKLLGKKVITQVMEKIKDEMVSGSLLVWEINTEEWFPDWK